MINKVKENLNKIKDAKFGMKNAIAACKGTPTTDLYSYDESIKSISPEYKGKKYYKVDFSPLNYNLTETYLAYKNVDNNFLNFFLAKKGGYPRDMTRYFTGTQSGKTYVCTIYIPSMNTANTYSFNRCFANLSNLLKIESIDMTEATDSTMMFYDCQKLTDVTFHNSYRSKLIKFTDMFKGCYNLKNLKGLRLAVSEDVPHAHLNLSYSPNLTHESLIDILYHLPDWTGWVEDHPYITLGQSNFNKLTPEEINTARKSGWGVKA